MPNGIGEIGWWCPSLDDDNAGTTTLQDFGTGGNDITLSNVIWTNDTDAGGVRRLDFDGATSFGDSGESDLFNFGASDFAVSFWVTSTAGNAWRSLISKLHTCWELGTRNSTNSPLNFQLANTLRNYSTAQMFNQGWVHVVATRQGTVVNNYFDGVLGSWTTNDGAPATVPDSASTLQIGRRAGGGQPFDGSLDDIRIFDRLLQPQEIHALSHSRAYQGPVVTGIGPEVAGASGTTVTTTKPTNTAVGDLLILAISYRSGGGVGGTPDTPANWELIGNTNDTSSNGEITNTFCYRRISDGTADDEPTVPGFGMAYGWNTRMQSVVNFDPVNPVGAAAVTEATANPAPLPVVTATADDSLAFVFGISGRGGAGSTITWPTGYHENYFDSQTGLYRCFISMSQVTLDDTESTSGDSNGWLGTTAYPTQQIAFVVNPKPPPAPPAAQPRIIPVLRGSGSMGKGQ